MLGLENSPKHCVVNYSTLILMYIKSNTLFGNAMFAFFLKHAVCNRSVWPLVNKRRVNTACSNTVFDLQTAKRSHFDKGSFAVFVP